MSETRPATLASALRAVLALPAVMGGAIPIGLALMDPWAIGWWPPGLVVVGIGVLVVAWTVRDFFKIGRGTLAPWDPPRHLVTAGLFARCRNPMYVGVLLTVLGWSKTFRSPFVLGYAILVALVFHLRVLHHEEPWAERTFGDDWHDYRAHVPRWLPRWRPWDGRSTNQ